MAFNEKINRDFMMDILRDGRVKVTFTKVDGTERVMECTLNSDLIPEEKRPTPAKPKADGTLRKESEEVVRAYAFDVNDWRSFRMDSLKAFTLITN